MTDKITASLHLPQMETSVSIKPITFLPAIAWFITSLILLTLPGSTIPKIGWMDAIQADKIVHIGLFGMLSFLFFLPFIKFPSSFEQKRQSILWIALGALAYGIIMEFVQKYWVPNRSFDGYDIVADGVGSFLPLGFRKVIYRFVKPVVS